MSRNRNGSHARGEEARLWQAALNRANVALSGEGLLSVINPCHIPICYSPIFNFLVDKQQTMYTCSMYSGLKATHWRRWGEKEKGLEEVLYCSREVWSSAGKLVRHNSRTPVHTIVKFNKLWGSFHQSFPVPLCHE